MDLLPWLTYEPLLRLKGGDASFSTHIPGQEGDDSEDRDVDKGGVLLLEVPLGGKLGACIVTAVSVEIPRLCRTPDTSIERVCLTDREAGTSLPLPFMGTLSPGQPSVLCDSEKDTARVAGFVLHCVTPRECVRDLSLSIYLTGIDPMMRQAYETQVQRVSVHGFDIGPAAVIPHRPRDILALLHLHASVAWAHPDTDRDTYTQRDTDRDPDREGRAGSHTEGSVPSPTGVAKSSPSPSPSSQVDWENVRVAVAAAGYLGCLALLKGRKFVQGLELCARAAKQLGCPAVAELLVGDAACAPLMAAELYTLVAEGLLASSGGQGQGLVARALGGAGGLSLSGPQHNQMAAVSCVSTGASDANDLIDPISGLSSPLQVYPAARLAPSVALCIASQRLLPVAARLASGRVALPLCIGYQQSLGARFLERVIDAAGPGLGRQGTLLAARELMLAPSPPPEPRSGRAPTIDTHIGRALTAVSGLLRCFVPSETAAVARDLFSLHVLAQGQVQQTRLYSLLASALEACPLSPSVDTPSPLPVPLPLDALVTGVSVCHGCVERGSGGQQGEGMHARSGVEAERGTNAHEGVRGVPSPDPASGQSALSDAALRLLQLVGMHSVAHRDSASQAMGWASSVLHDASVVQGVGPGIGASPSTVGYQSLSGSYHQPSPQMSGVGGGVGSLPWADRVIGALALLRGICHQASQRQRQSESQSDCLDSQGAGAGTETETGPLCGGDRDSLGLAADGFPLLPLSLCPPVLSSPTSSESLPSCHAVVAEIGSLCRCLSDNSSHAPASLVIPLSTDLYDTGAHLLLSLPSSPDTVRALVGPFLSVASSHLTSTSPFPVLLGQIRQVGCLLCRVGDRASGVCDTVLALLLHLVQWVPLCVETAVFSAVGGLLAVLLGTEGVSETDRCQALSATITALLDSGTAPHTERDRLIEQVTSHAEGLVEGHPALAASVVSASVVSVVASPSHTGEGVCARLVHRMGAPALEALVGDLIGGQGDTPAGGSTSGAGVQSPSLMHCDSQDTMAVLGGLWVRVAAAAAWAGVSPDVWTPLLTTLTQTPCALGVVHLKCLSVCAQCLEGGHKPQGEAEADTAAVAAATSGHASLSSLGVQALLPFSAYAAAVRDGSLFYPLSQAAHALLDVCALIGGACSDGTGCRGSGGEGDRTRDTLVPSESPVHSHTGTASSYAALLWDGRPPLCPPPLSLMSTRVPSPPLPWHDMTQMAEVTLPPTIPYVVSRTDLPSPPPPAVLGGPATPMVYSTHGAVGENGGMFPGSMSPPPRDGPVSLPGDRSHSPSASPFPGRADPASLADLVDRLPDSKVQMRDLAGRPIGETLVVAPRPGSAASASHTVSLRASREADVLREVAHRHRQRPSTEGYIARRKETLASKQRRFSDLLAKEQAEWAASTLGDGGEEEVLLPEDGDREGDDGSVGLVSEGEDLMRGEVERGGSRSRSGSPSPSETDKKGQRREGSDAEEEGVWEREREDRALMLSDMVGQRRSDSCESSDPSDVEYLVVDSSAERRHNEVMGGVHTEDGFHSDSLYSPRGGDGYGEGESGRESGGRTYSSDRGSPALHGHSDDVDTDTEYAQGAGYVGTDTSETRGSDADTDEYLDRGGGSTHSASGSKSVGDFGSGESVTPREYGYREEEREREVSSTGSGHREDRTDRRSRSGGDSGSDGEGESPGIDRTPDSHGSRPASPTPGAGLEGSVEVSEVSDQVPVPTHRDRDRDRDSRDGGAQYSDGYSGSEETEQRAQEGHLGVDADAQAMGRSAGGMSPRSQSSSPSSERLFHRCREGEESGEESGEREPSGASGEPDYIGEYGYGRDTEYTDPYPIPSGYASVSEREREGEGSGSGSEAEVPMAMAAQTPRPSTYTVRDGPGAKGREGSRSAVSVSVDRTHTPPESQHSSTEEGSGRSDSMGEDYSQDRDRARGIDGQRGRGHGRESQSPDADAGTGRDRHHQRRRRGPVSRRDRDRDRHDHRHRRHGTEYVLEDVGGTGPASTRHHTQHGGRDGLPTHTPHSHGTYSDVSSDESLSLGISDLRSPLLVSRRVLASRSRVQAESWVDPLSISDESDSDDILFDFCVRQNSLTVRSPQERVARMRALMRSRYNID
ncbi:hypothetical protein KIPB_001366 [Kipferlia bialata]|uniref:Uncharacterized protein n=1 Tax=Kipferlia bialata TaxID=797122 RepID=A0A9K3GFH2_9EUKA|nr:hypothetical protein KIPB_001366 [Kipferlia bialata]|eukprot:g1366.t1